MNNIIYENILKDLKDIFSMPKTNVYIKIYDQGKTYQIQENNMDMHLPIAKLVNEQYSIKEQNLEKFLKDYSDYLYDIPNRSEFKIINNNVEDKFLNNIIELFLNANVSPELFRKLYYPFKEILCSYQTIYSLHKKNITFTIKNNQQNDYIYDLLEDNIILSKTKTELKSIGKENQIKNKIESVLIALDYFIENGWSVNDYKLVEKLELFLENHKQKFPEKIENKKPFEEMILNKLKKIIPEQYLSNLTHYFVTYGKRQIKNPLFSYNTNIILNYSIEKEEILNRQLKTITINEAQQMVIDVFSSLKKYYDGDFLYEMLGDDFQEDKKEINVFIKLKDNKNIDNIKIENYLNKAINIMEYVLTSLYESELNNNIEKENYLESLIKSLNLEDKIKNKDKVMIKKKKI